MQLQPPQAVTTDTKQRTLPVITPAGYVNVEAYASKLYLAADVQLIKVRRLGNSFYDQQA